MSIQCVVAGSAISIPVTLLTALVSEPTEIEFIIQAVGATAASVTKLKTTSGVTYVSTTRFDVTLTSSDTSGLDPGAYDIQAWVTIGGNRTAVTFNTHNNQIGILKGLG